MVKKNFNIINSTRCRYGIVVKVRDGIAYVRDFDFAKFGALVVFESSSRYVRELVEKGIVDKIRGIVMSIEEKFIAVVAFGSERTIRAGDRVSVENDVVDIRVGIGLLGRIIDPLGYPLDNKNAIINLEQEPFDSSGKGYYLGFKKLGYQRPVETPVPGIIDRKPIRRPLLTGLRVLDSMIPIGLGQRELIIGDRQTGKTVIAVDMMLNQAFLNERLREKYMTVSATVNRLWVKLVNSLRAREAFIDSSWIFRGDANAVEPKSICYCIYVAIGQRQATVTRIAKTLNKSRHLYERRFSPERFYLFKPLNYCIIMATISSDPAALQYLAPYAGCTVGEFFRDNGLNAVVVYDDLSKHAVAYRQISLLLRRPSGREAYPGDIFYLHSRLLERAAQLSNTLKGGSLTAFPIVETQYNNFAAFIPTNVISITDGQVFLDRRMFHEGMRPAVNTRLSISRVGANAQFKSIRGLVGQLRTQLAKYYLLKDIVHFSDDIDIATQRILDRGYRLTEILCQDKYTPQDIAVQTLLLYSGVSGFLDNIQPNTRAVLFIHKFSSFMKLLDYNRIKSVEGLERFGLLNDWVKRFLVLDILEIYSTIKIINN